LCTHTRARVRDSVHACACACGQCARARACSCECKRVRVRACIQALTHSRCLAVSPLPSQPSFRPSLPLSLPAPPSLVSFPLPRPPSLPFFSPFSLSFPHPTPLATIAAARSTHEVNAPCSAPTPSLPPCLSLPPSRTYSTRPLSPPSLTYSNTLSREVNKICVVNMRSVLLHTLADLRVGRGKLSANKSPIPHHFGRHHLNRIYAEPRIAVYLMCARS
jgi:hypothetical protein